MHGLRIALVALTVAVSGIAGATEGPSEEFAQFLARFASDTAFRESRIELPLPTIRGNPTDPRIKAKWSLEKVRKELTPPVPSSALEAQGLVQEVTHPRKSEVEVQQSQRESDSHILIYRFKLVGGQWRLASFEDSSY